MAQRGPGRGKGVGPRPPVAGSAKPPVAAPQSVEAPAAPAIDELPPVAAADTSTLAIAAELSAPAADQILPAVEAAMTAAAAQVAADTPRPEPEAPSVAEDQKLPATPVAAAADDVISKEQTVMATTFEATKNTAEKTLGDFNSRAKGAMEKSAKFAEEMTEFTKGNVEAVVASGRVAAKGAETLAQDVAETVRKNFEASTTAMKSLAGVKSPTELFQLQSEFAKSYFDTLVADTSKFSESMMKLAGDIAQPLSSRYAVAADKIKTASPL